MCSRYEKIICYDWIIPRLLEVFVCTDSVFIANLTDLIKNISTDCPPSVTLLQTSFNLHLWELALSWVQALNENFLTILQFARAIPEKVNCAGCWSCIFILKPMLKYWIKPVKYCQAQAQVKVLFWNSVTFCGSF